MTKNKTESPVVTIGEKLKRFNISSIDNTFEHFFNSRGTTKAYNLMKSVGNGRSDRKFVFLVGRPGTGKTHLIEAVIIAWAKRGLFTHYQTMSQLMRRLKEGLNKEAKQHYSDIFKQLCDTPRLIIDDYGMGTTETKWEVAQIEAIINERYHKRNWEEDKVTIMATNEDIKQLPERVASRFYDASLGIVIVIKANDYRKRGAN